MSLNQQDLLWAVRRLPKPVGALLKAHPGRAFVAGGYLRSCITSEPIADIDVFASSKEEAAAFAKEVAGERDRVTETENAITVKGRGPVVQFIHRWTFATPADALASFDFTIASAAIWWDGARWQSACHESYYADLAAKRLVYLRPARNEDAGGSILRVLKFYQRGYRIPLDSLGAVIARLMQGVKDTHRVESENGLGMVLTGLLREVDPLIDPDHISHLPSMTGPVDDEAGE